MLNVLPVAPLLHVTVRVPVPPAVVTVILPPPLQPGCVALPEMVNGEGAVKVADAVVVQPSPSVTVTEYDPGAKLVKLALTELLLQA